VTSASYEEAPEVCPDAVEAMLEVGLNISGRRLKKADEFLGERFGYVVTLCDRQKERTCPISPGAVWRHSWRLKTRSHTARRKNVAGPFATLATTYDAASSNLSARTSKGNHLQCN